jgi:hypothetical protein
MWGQECGLYIISILIVENTFDIRTEIINNLKYPKSYFLFVCLNSFDVMKLFMSREQSFHICP